MKRQGQREVVGHGQDVVRNDNVHSLEVLYQISQNLIFQLLKPTKVHRMTSLGGIHVRVARPEERIDPNGQILLKYSPFPG